ncbi:hypothetical protein EV363DRAFT_1561939 [Boletus edulis]|nr:hypothetical protein EV363DRAFT_1561939 [Boletus edulis]
MDPPPEKRKPGRPKGTKNKPTAKNVGRPRKDGRLPQKRTAPANDEGQTPGALNMEASAPITGTNQPTSEQRGRRPRAASSQLSLHQVQPGDAAREHELTVARGGDIETATADVLAVPAPRELSASLPSVGNDGRQSPLDREHESQNPVIVEPTATGTQQQHIVLSDGDSETRRVCQHAPDGPDPCDSESRTSSWPWRHDQNVPERPPTPLLLNDSTDNSITLIDADNPYSSDLTLASKMDNPDSGAEVLEDDPRLEEEFRGLHLNDVAVRDDEKEAYQHGVDPASKPDPRAGMPAWLHAHTKFIQDMLKLEIQRSTRNPPMPRCYEQQTYRVWDSSPYLTLLSQPRAPLEPAVFHRPKFFIWLPHCLLGDRILCPQCKAVGRRSSKGCAVYLQKQGFIENARRVVDINCNMYLIGYRYQCGVDGCRRSYRSWSPEILDILPAAVSAEFPFLLTRRSGISKPLASLLRASIQGGMGADAVTQMIQSFHYEKFDELHAQYLQLVLDRFKACPPHFWVKKESFGTFSDPNGYAGFVPSASYLARFYDMLVERDSPELKQCIALLPARTLAIDHSFKVVKRLGRVGGAPLFTALHTMVNDYGEIRSMLFTMTKGHDQFMPNMHEIARSLTKFGHGKVEAVFTDNVHADKEEVQRAFPSLLEDVVPVPAHSTLPSLVLPEQTWRVVHLSTALQVNLRFDIIMNHRTVENPVVTVAFGMQWPVNIETGIQSPVSTIQVAYQEVVYIIQTASFIHHGHIDLPHSLLTFLRSPSFKKVGINIGADFKRLQCDCGKNASSLPFSGYIELGSMAKDRGVAVKRNVALAELVGTQLRAFLPKDPHIQVSPRWADVPLPSEFVSHAVLDVYAVSEVYQRLLGLEVAQPITAKTPGGTPVALLASNGAEVAHGIIALERPQALDGINLTATRAVMTISKIIIPSFLLPASLCRSKHSVSLASLGPLPTSIVCNTRNLRVCLWHHHSDDPSNSRLGIRACASEATNLPSALDTDLPAPELVFQENGPDGLLPDGPDSDDLVAVEAAVDDNIGSEPEQPLEESARDPDAELVLSRVMEPYENMDLATGAVTTHTRVILDNWHCHNLFPVSRQHGLRRPFFRALSMAFLLPVMEDVSVIEPVLKKLGTSYNAQLLSRPKWLHARVRRMVPSPEVLLPRVAEVIKTYGPVRDATTSQPLFNARAWDVARNVLENTRLGYYSDPPGVDLYFKMGEDKNGLTVYRCCRGTNSVEGGVHQNIIRKYDSFNTSPRHAINMILEYTIRHNVTVGTHNRTGHEYIGHFNIPLKNRVAHLLDNTIDALKPSSAQLRGQWVNGNDYDHANESFGIIQFKPDFFKPLGMFEYNDQYAHDQQIHHRWVAEQQGTLVAVLPVHTREERDLFRLLVHSSPLFSDVATRQPNWTSLAAVWATHANGKTIFYKVRGLTTRQTAITSQADLVVTPQLPEHLKVYYKIWNDYCNESNTIALNTDAANRIRALLRSRPLDSNPTAPTALPMTLRDTLAAPNPSTTLEIFSPWQIGNLLDHHSLQQSALLYIYADTAHQATTRSNTATMTASRAPLSRGLKRKQAASDADNNMSSGAGVAAPTRAARRCLQCFSTTCNGRWKKARCTQINSQGSHSMTS